jgi:hypothetical protein
MPDGNPTNSVNFVNIKNAQVSIFVSFFPQFANLRILSEYLQGKSIMNGSRGSLETATFFWPPYRTVEDSSPDLADFEQTNRVTIWSYRMRRHSRSKVLTSI